MCRFVTVSLLGEEVEVGLVTITRGAGEEDDIISVYYKGDEPKKR